MNTLVKFRNYFSGFISYNLAFLIFQLVYIFFYDISFIHALALPFRVYLILCLSFLPHIFFLFLLSYLQTAWLRGLSFYFKKEKSLINLQLAIFFFSILSLFIINFYFFSNSKFSNFIGADLLSPYKTSILLIDLLIIFALTLNAIRFDLILKLICIGAALIGAFSHFKPDKSFNQLSKPNLIIIGVDSLNLRYVNHNLTPTIAQFISQSVVFDEVISPLARTYPAWASILTGLYPIHHFARENLIPKPLVRSQASIAWPMKKLGYTTIYATDDRRFNNLDNEFGFDEIVGPPIGISEIIMGTFNDFPLTNIFINCKWTKWLFPYNYMNRASYFSYYPSTFDSEISATLLRVPHDKPLFFVAHLTLAHWPYTWAESKTKKLDNEFDLTTNKDAYILALKKVDQQLAHLLTSLKEKGLFNTSMIILLSDHGETLYEPGSRLTQLSNYQSSKQSPFNEYLIEHTFAALDKSAGHGSDLLSPDQYHCLLAFKLLKNGRLSSPIKTISSRVSLIDIAPTIADYFNISLPFKPDGISLLSFILNDALPPGNRSIMMESGIYPNQNLTKHSIIDAVKQFYRVNVNTTLLEIKPEQLPALEAMKLYGVVNGNWLLALYPDNKEYVSVLLRLDNKTWDDKLASSFFRNSPYTQLLNGLKQFYARTFYNKEH